MTLTRAAAAVGVHISTVCRWHAADPALRRALREAHMLYRIAWFAAQPCRPRDLSADRQAVLKHVAAQTGLTVTTEKRLVWVLSVTKPEGGAAPRRE